MDRLDAVETAKQYIVDLYQAEGISKPRLEELTLDRVNNIWLVTIGFTYLVGGDRSATLTPSLAKAVYGDRVYKLVKVDDQDGEVVAMTDRLLDPSLPS